MFARSRAPLFALLASLLLSCRRHAASAAGEPAPTPPAPSVTAAAPAPSTTAAVITRSPAALAALLADYDRLVASGADAASLERARDVIDHTAAQRDAVYSRLYWYTDLAEAKAEAKKIGRPILSLRLLGHLDDELSCANSRLFRIVLYANRDVSRFLASNFILHWSSERPAPQLTLDYGDGRVVRRTITGNSIHYVLDAEGRVVDALPGLYGPNAFTHGLTEPLETARKSGALGDHDARVEIAKYQSRALVLATIRWRGLIKKAYVNYYDDMSAVSLPAPVKLAWSNPLYDSLPAPVVNQLTVSKADIEAPPLALMQPTIYASSPWEGWDKLAAHLPAEQLDDSSRSLFAQKHPRLWTSLVPKPLDEAALTARLRSFGRDLTVEETRNEYVMRSAIRRKLAGRAPVSFDDLNMYVYTKLFMTPRDDAWLGLVGAQSITGIEDDGLATSTAGVASPKGPKLAAR